MDFKALPYNLEAEAEVLGAIMLDNNKILDSYEILTADDFYVEKHKYIYAAILNIFKESKPVDIITLSVALKDSLNTVGGITYLSQLTSSNLGNEIKEHCWIIRELSNNRRIIKECTKAIERAYNKDSSKEIIETFENNILEIDNTTKGLINSAELMEKTLSYITENYQNGGGLIGMQSGFKNIDIATNGFIKKDVVVIAGRPSMGKTLLAMAIAEGISKNNIVAFFELEMSDENIGIRQVSNKTKINGVKLQKGSVDEAEWEEIANAMNLISTNKLWLDTSSTQTILDIKNKCRKMKLKYGLDCVVIDHIGLIEPTKDMKHESKNTQIGEITRQAKIMAKDLDVNVILLSQLSRALELRSNKRPTLSDLRDSGNIEQDADLIMFVYREEYYKPNTMQKNIIELIIGKQRNGKVGDLRLHCNLTTQSLYDFSK